MAANRGAEITLSWLSGSRAQRIAWLLESLSLKYTLQTHQRLAQGRAPPALKALHPLGKSPILTIQYPSTPKPVILAESGAIVEHVVENFGNGKLVPAKYTDGKEGFGMESEAYRRYRYFMHYAEGSLMPVVFTSILMNAIKNAPVPFPLYYITRFIANKVSNEYTTSEYATHFSFLEEQLASAPSGGGYLCGSELSAADIMVSFPIMVALQLAVDGEKYPRVKEYVEKLKAEEGYKRAIERVEEAEGKEYVLV